jgi:hypothetical protein
MHCGVCLLARKHKHPAALHSRASIATEAVDITMSNLLESCRMPLQVTMERSRLTAGNHLRGSTGPHCARHCCTTIPCNT